MSFYAQSVVGLYTTALKGSAGMTPISYPMTHDRGMLLRLWHWPGFVDRRRQERPLP